MTSYMSKNLSIVSALAGAFVCASSAFAVTDVYVTQEGAGEMDGSSWDNAMKNITDAYAKAAEDPAGGTVHIAGGIYRSSTGNWTAGVGLNLADNITVSGEGTDENPVYITGDMHLNNVYCDIGNQPVWNNNRVTLPPEGAITRVAAISGNNDDSSFVSSTNEVSGLVFTNLIFTGFKDIAINVKGAIAPVFTDCKFYANGNNSAHPLSAAIAVGTSATVERCEFIGNNCGINFDPAAEAELLVKDSLFRSQRDTGAYCKTFPAGIYAGAKGTLSVTGCQFKDLTSLQGIAIVMGGSTTLTVKESLFSNCIAQDVPTPQPVINSGNGGLVDLENVSFVSNTIKATSKSAYCDAACVGTDCSLIAKNCYFGDNKLIMTGSAANYGAGVIWTGINFRGAKFINCLAENNCSSGTVSQSALINGWRRTTVAFVNSVSLNNSCWTGTNRFYEVITKNTDVNDPKKPMFINSIFWNDDADYKFTPTSEYTAGIGVASSVIKNFTPFETATGNGFFYSPVLDTNPLLSGNYQTKGWLRAMPLLSVAERAVRNNAMRVCKATTGDYYFLDTNMTPAKWRLIGPVDGGSITLAQGEAIGLNAETATIPDMFGHARLLTGGPIGLLATCAEPGIKVMVK